MTSTTSSLPATPLQASRLQDNLPAATAATSGAATVPAAAAAAALVAGATGLVGRAVLDRLLDDKHYRVVHCAGRRAPALQHPRLEPHEVKSFADFTSPPVDEVFIALGTTLKIAGSRQAFRAVDFDAVLAVARAALAAGATRLGVVSAMGADSDSRIFYSRVKGEMEEAVSQLGFSTIVFVRPSLLVGDRHHLQQPTRRGEEWGFRIGRMFGPLIPANYRPVAATDVAAALVDAVQSAAPGKHVLLSGDILKHQPQQGG